MIRTEDECLAVSSHLGERMCKLAVQAPLSFGSNFLAINGTKYTTSTANDTWLVSARVNYKSVNYDFAVSPSLSGTTDFNIQRFACGPANLSGTISALSGAVEGDSYTVQFLGNSGSSVQTTFTFGPCQRFDSIPVHFVNKYGGIDSYTFTMKNRKRANIQREVFGYNRKSIV